MFFDSFFLSSLWHQMDYCNFKAHEWNRLFYNLNISFSLEVPFTRVIKSWQLLPAPAFASIRHRVLLTSKRPHGCVSTKKILPRAVLLVVTVSSAPLKGRWMCPRSLPELFPSTASCGPLQAAPWRCASIRFLYSSAQMAKWEKSTWVKSVKVIHDGAQSGNPVYNCSCVTSWFAELIF